MEQRNLFLLLLTLRTPWIKKRFNAVHRTAWWRETSFTQTTPQSCSSDILGPVNLESPHAVAEFQKKNKMYPVDRRAAKTYSLPCIDFFFHTFQWTNRFIWKKFCRWHSATGKDLQNKAVCAEESAQLTFNPWGFTPKSTLVLSVV